MPATPTPHPRTLELIDEVLESIGNAIHDGPIQDIVVAQLLTKVVLPSTEPEELHDRTMDALRRANTHSRRLMWALAVPRVREGRVAEDLPNIIAAEAGTTIEVHVADDTPHHLVVDVVRALHHVVAGEVLADRAIATVSLQGSAAGVECEVAVGGPPPEEDADLTVWQRLARARLGHDGGSFRVSAAGLQTLIRLELSGHVG